ncbi:hypothetical protein DRE_00303 [Drechslerella stenobrocha 248]|uniref:Exonuclease domain-containing protein n=1 Tax=Drechslerella stenobrocha 248 TaxID=1043628 RepID=W7IE88_9PEZI|nr:hypothetical protein DRE_00303 [Drechslerella stenobrocha 248]
MFRALVLATRRGIAVTVTKPKSTLAAPLSLSLRGFKSSAIRMSVSGSSAPPVSAAAAQAVIEGVQAALQHDSTKSPPLATAPKSLKSDNPLVWIDCEMTGLNPPADKLIQIACYITDSQLNLLDETGFETVISRPKALLDGMDDWCVDTHGKTGLTARVLSSNVTVEDASAALLEYIKKYVPEPRTAIMCGNSIHFDKLFLALEMPDVINHLYYRIGDVSSIKEFAKRWCDEDVLRGLPEKKYTHEARNDILESIEEARYYRRVLFGAKSADGEQK